MIEVTEELLERIKKWKITTPTDVYDLLDTAVEAWQYEDRAVKEGALYTFSTGGSSENEDIIWAMEQNGIFWSISWHSSRRGGHYIFCADFINSCD